MNFSFFLFSPLFELVGEAILTVVDVKQSGCGAEFFSPYPRGGILILAAPRGGMETSRFEAMTLEKRSMNGGEASGISRQARTTNYSVSISRLRFVH